MKRTHLCVLALAACTLGSCNKKQKDLAEAPVNALSVVTTTVQKRQSDHQISISGNIEGEKTVRLGFMVAGKIGYIAAEEGQKIGKGQLISSLEPTNYAIGKEIADVQVAQVQDEYQRLKIMHDRRSISESDFSKISHGLEQSKAQQKLQAKNLSDTRLYSPISGVLLTKGAEVGEITGTGTPLFVVADISTVKAVAYIPEGELHNIKLGQEATVLVSSLNETFKGKITEVGSAADPSSRAFTVKITIRNPKLLIRPGMIAEAKINSGEKSEFLAVPTEAVLKNLDNQSIVYVVDKGKNKAFERKVSLGRLTDNYIEILAGLHPGDVIVTSGQNKLTNGADVAVKQADVAVNH
ncbi:efflux RND transporter periplasmic adaptor subunit [Dyadobacter sp. CY261]|uniref:efflux RND transporter periplasmic adaptor subunit n=1 Tax=Dyadobacter sp. CY261 TaxID=2907203 RepID=UPI001F323408|nr:efflux RND transporter periplasmic adaptor subunit [Dyadobacter sp. CY261]MCF0069644.1 efflux RND transporter periplasmic adaptor subunit [Dyadobacter sp. CY261]